MVDTPLDYDKIIWTIFSVGVGFSVIALYQIDKIPFRFQLLTLILGFAVLIYSFFAIKGYGFKKEILYEENNNIKFKERLKGRFYFRTRWIGESILIFLGIIYSKK